MGLKIRAEVPSNIALIKYWGKEAAATQWPANSSLSMTLKGARTITLVEGNESGEIQFFLNEKMQHSAKMLNFVGLLKREFQYESGVTIRTENTFPASCGIASSASGYACLTLAFAALGTKSVSWEELNSAGYSRQKLASLARLGSGSACRSFFGGFVAWHKAESPMLQQIEKISSPLLLADTIVIVSAEEKQLSSSEGHSRAWTSPFFRKRLEQVPTRFAELKKYLEEGDLLAVGSLAETDSDEMHHVMESGNPPAFYRTDETMTVLRWVKDQRSKGLGCFATVDAGPNVHILSHIEDQEILQKRLKEAFPNYRIIADQIGQDDDLFFQQVNT